MQYAHCCVTWLYYRGDTRSGIWVAVALTALRFVYIRKGVLVRQRLSAMTSSVLLIRNVGTWKIVITVLTELHRQRLREPHCELLQAETGSLQLKASRRCLKLGPGRRERQERCQARNECTTRTAAVSGVPSTATKINIFCWNNIRLSARPLYYYQRLNLWRIFMKFGILIRY